MRTCRNILLVAAAAIMAVEARGGVGATEAWVKRYVAQRLGEPDRTANGTNYYVREGVEIAVEEATEYAFVISEDTELSRAHGIVRGMVFAPTSPSRAVHGAYGMTLGTNGVSMAVGGVEYKTKYRNFTEMWLYDFAGSNWLCRVSGTFIQPGYAARILAGGE